jgi:hypothetical protein
VGSNPTLVNILLLLYDYLVELEKVVEWVKNQLFGNLDMGFVDGLFCA